MAEEITAMARTAKECKATTATEQTAPTVRICTSDVQCTTDERRITTA